MAQPPFQCLVGEFCPFEVAHPEGINDAALGGVEPDGLAAVEVDGLPPEIECVWVEVSPPNGRGGLRSPGTAWDRNVDLSRDVVDQLVTRQSRTQTQRRLSRLGGNLDQVLITEPIALAVQAAREGDDAALGDKAKQLAFADAIV